MNIIKNIGWLSCCFRVISKAYVNLVNFEGFARFWYCLAEIMRLFLFLSIISKVIRKMMVFGWAEMTI